MSKQGRAEPRAILYMTALSAIQHNPLIKELYARCMKKGMKPSAALGVCMHKILRKRKEYSLKQKALENSQIVMDSYQTVS